MPDRIASDHASVDSHRVTIKRRGRTDRPRIDLVDVDGLPIDTVVHLTLAETVYRTRITETFEGDPEIRGVYDNARLARSSGGTDRLDEWRKANDLEFGRSVCLDVVVPGHAYGIRLPGDHQVYEITDPPTDSLQSIARSLDDASR